MSRHYMNPVPLALLAFITSFMSWGQTTQDSLVSPVVWYRTDKGAVGPMEWEDQSGHGRDGTSTLEYGPTLTDTLHYQHSLYFDGLDDQYILPYDISSLRSLTVIGAYWPSDSLERGLWHISSPDGNGVPMLLTTHRSQSPDTATAWYAGGNRNPVVTSTVHYWDGSTPITEGSQIILGNSGETLLSAQPFKGCFSEFMIYDHALGFMERTQVETYLCLKYGISKQEGNYVSSSLSMLWDLEKNSAYGHRITGLGRDDAFGLYQRQSGNVSDTVLSLGLSVGPFTPLNDENRGVLHDGRYLVWGDNNGALKTLYKEKNGTGIWVLGREWLMVPTGPSPRASVLRVDLKGLPADSSGYWLAIDRSGEGLSDLDLLEYFEPDSLDGDSLAYYHGLTWDKEGSGSDIFGFVRKAGLLPMVRVLSVPTCTAPDSGSVSISIAAGKGRYEFLVTGPGYSRTWQGEGSMLLEGLVAGDYVLKARKNGAGWSERGFTLEMEGSLTVDLGPDRPLVPGELLILDAGASLPDSLLVSYTWAGSHGFSATSREVGIDQPGVYKAEVKRLSDGCIFSDEVTLTGETMPGFSVYPSLVDRQEVFNITISLEKSQDITVKIYDVTGRLYKILSGSGSSEYFFTASLVDAGVYLVVLETSSGTDTRKMIVE
ncbi:MAG: T9SS type A sorting domain-containing protein [Cyclobacteriaceae bacterium]|nr:T9SS type A sorting domain-containing protein [Cyclobacteriaceae bacterium]